MTDAFIMEGIFPSLRSLHPASRSDLVFARVTRPRFHCVHMECSSEPMSQTVGSSFSCSMCRSSVSTWVPVRPGMEDCCSVRSRAGICWFSGHSIIAWMRVSGSCLPALSQSAHMVSWYWIGRILLSLTLVGRIPHISDSKSSL